MFIFNINMVAITIIFAISLKGYKNVPTKQLNNHKIVSLLAFVIS